MSAFVNKVNDAFLPNSQYFLYTPGPTAKKLPFRVMACGHFYSTSSYDVEREGLNNCLLLITLNGAGEIDYENRHFLLQKGKAVLVDCSQYHHYKTVEDMWEILWVRFDCNQGIDYLQLINGDPSEPLTLENMGAFEKNIDKILQLTQVHAPTTDLLLSNLISAILTELGVQKHQQSTVHLPASAKKIIAEAILFLEVHYATDISIEQLAQSNHLSQYSFIRLFKKQTGSTPYEFLLKIRITKAKILLEQGDITIDQISMMVGFNNENNFIRKFKLLTGTTPLKYRNMTGIISF
jgi:AraC family transcriptional regulator